VKPALLDLNILLALFWPAHEHHGAALGWFESRRQEPWATCPLTQLGFIRIVTNPSFSSEALSIEHATLLLEANTSLPEHRLWTDDLSVFDALEECPRALQGHRQVTDAYLLALANRHRGTLATFDRGIAAMAAGWRESAVELVSTRIA
jgi:toxin-antitoxin system PIN domain toxin